MAKREIQAAVLPPEGFVRLPIILAVFPVSRSSWWAGVRAGRYPPGQKISRRCTAWDVRVIRELIERTANQAISAEAP